MHAACHITQSFPASSGRFFAFHLTVSLSLLSEHPFGNLHTACSISQRLRIQCCTDKTMWTMILALAVGSSKFLGWCEEEAHCWVGR